MKILITGGCGFVGTNIALYLSSIGHKVSSLDNLSRNGSKYNLNLLKKEKIKNFKVDIKNFHQLIKIPKFELIIDCCAEAAVEVSKEKIDKVINSNLNKKNLLNAFLNLSNSNENQNVQINEINNYLNEIVKDYSPYDVSVNRIKKLILFPEPIKN